MVLGLVPVVGFLIHVLADFVIGLGGFILRVILAVKAQGRQRLAAPAAVEMTKVISLTRDRASGRGHGVQAAART